MKLRAFLYISLSLCLHSFTSEAQNLILDISGKTPQQTQVIDSIGYQNTFEDFKSLNSEINRVQSQLNKAGYLESEIAERTQIKDTTKVTLDLKQKYYTIYIYDYKNYISESLLSNVSNEITPDYFRVPITELESTLNYLNKTLIAQGAPFSTLQLKNIEKKEKTHLRAQLEISSQEQRTITNIIVKGYEKFPPSYIKHYLKLKKGTALNLEEIQNQSQHLNNLSFANESRSPELLFTKDSTNLYLYIEKAKSNSFDGFLGFGTNETSNKLEFDGYLNLILNNNLNYGETLRLNYKSDELDQKTFNLNLELPYLFKSPIGTEFGLSIFKKDSSFTTVRQTAGLFYQVTPKQKIQAGIDAITSSNLLDIDINNLNDYESTFYKGSYEYRTRDSQSLLFQDSFKLRTTIGFGTRKESGINTQQTRGEIDTHKILNFNTSNSLFLRVTGAALLSDTYLLNELFRFGGINSIRGFEENSLESSKHLVINSEYRYALSSNLYIHSIIDAAYFENDLTQTREKLFGFGFGFGIITQAGLLRFNYANGKSESQNFKLSNSKIHLSLNARF